MPLSADLTFSILNYYLAKYQLIGKVSTQQDELSVFEMIEHLLNSSACKVFKTLSQIVDMNQQAKNTVSFQSVLVKLGFERADVLAHMRNGFFHQERANRQDLEMGFSLLWKEMKRLYWDKNYNWIMVGMRSVDPKKLSHKQVKPRKRERKFSEEEIITKAEINDVDEYSDCCLAQKNLLNFIKENSSKLEAHQEGVLNFIKHSVKGLHRKIAVANLSAIHAERLLKESLTASKPLSEASQSALSHFLSVLSCLLSIFSSNKNMQSLLKLSPLNRLSSSLAMLQFAGIPSKIEEKIEEKNEEKIGGDFLGASWLRDLEKVSQRLGKEGGFVGLEVVEEVGERIGSLKEEVYEDVEELLGKREVVEQVEKVEELQLGLEAKKKIRIGVQLRKQLESRGPNAYKNLILGTKEKKELSSEA